MTALSEQMKDKICVYCGNNAGGCLANIPYYGVSIYCGSFTENGAVKVEKPKRNYSRRKIMRSLVDTF